MARAVVRESVMVAGRAERARVARAFTAGVLGPGHPCGEDAALLAQGSGVFRTYPVLCSMRWWDGICAGCGHGHAT
jgi:hypothetical protein